MLIMFFFFFLVVMRNIEELINDDEEGKIVQIPLDDEDENEFFSVRLYDKHSYMIDLGFGSCRISIFFCLYVQFLANQVVFFFFAYR